MSNLEQAQERYRQRIRRVAQRLVEEIGATGPEDLESIVERACAEIASLRKATERLAMARGHDILSVWCALRGKVLCEAPEGMDRVVYEAELIRKERDEAREELDRCRAILASIDNCHADELDLDRVESLVVAGEWP